MGRLLFLLSCLSAFLHAQEPVNVVVRNLRLEGSLEARMPVALRSSHPIAVSFDVVDPGRPEVHVRVWHCDRDWKRTESIFLNDPVRNVFRGVTSSVRAPIGVQGYTFTYKFQLPGLAGFEVFEHSGNHVVEIWNADETLLLGSARFFVAETLAGGRLLVGNRRLPSASSPWNQVHRIVLSYVVPPPSPEETAPVEPSLVRTMDVYRNREFHHRLRVDVDDDDPETFIDGFGTRSLKFIYDHAPAGAPYRSMDLHNAGRYPPGVTLRQLDGVDLSRWQVLAGRDHFGVPSYVSEGNTADFVPFRFELLRPPELGEEDIRVVGEFNQWDPDDAWRLQRLAPENRYALAAQIRRGVQDYQYVLNGTDWLALEGNDWSAVCVYTAFVYYHDPRLGGYDRILIAVQGRSPGGAEATVN